MATRLRALAATHPSSSLRATHLNSLVVIRLSSLLAIRRRGAIRLSSLVATRPSHHLLVDIRRNRLGGTDLRAQRLAALSPKVRRPRRVQ